MSCQRSSILDKTKHEWICFRLTANECTLEENFTIACSYLQRAARNSRRCVSWLQLRWRVDVDVVAFDEHVFSESVSLYLISFPKFGARAVLHDL